MCKILIPCLATFIGLTSWVSLAGAELFSATGMVIAIVADDLFVGEAEGHLNGAGTLAIRSQKNPAHTCVGAFTSDAAKGGSGQLHCSDGTSATFQFQRLSVFRGYGVANFSRGPMTFAYGFTPDDAGPYLNLPSGKKLKHNGTSLVLVDLSD
jgi:hypothetical protein